MTKKNKFHEYSFWELYKMDESKMSFDEGLEYYQACSDKNPLIAVLYWAIYGIALLIAISTIIGLLAKSF